MITFVVILCFNILIKSSVGEILNTFWKKSDFNHITLVTKNLTKSIEYYTKLGFSVEVNKRRPHMGFNGAWLGIDTSRNMVELHLLENTNELSGGNTYNNEEPIQGVGYPHFTIQVNHSIDVFIDTYRTVFQNNASHSKQKIVLSGVRPIDRYRQIFLHDPDGNPMELISPRKEYKSLDLIKRAHELTSKYKEAINQPLLREERLRSYEDTLARAEQKGFKASETGEHLSAVAFDNPIAARVAARILRRGGSAADAVIAANAMLAVVEPMNSGVGGDLFAILYEPAACTTSSKEGPSASCEGKVVGLNGSGPLGSISLETMRQQLNARQMNDTTIPMYGTLAATTVPGTVSAWCALHERHGKLPWKDLFQPAISLAMQGFNVSLHTWKNWNHVTRAGEALIRGELTDVEYLDFMSVFAPGGTAPVPGEFVRNPALGRTLSMIAKGGCEAFYTGAIAEEIAAYMQSIGGYLTAEDLARYWRGGGATLTEAPDAAGKDSAPAEHKGAEWVTPICTAYRQQYQVHGIPGNTQALPGLQMLAVLDQYDPVYLAQNPVHRTFLLTSLKRLVYIYDRAVSVGDGPVPVIQGSGECESKGASIRKVLGLTPAEIKTMIDEAYRKKTVFPIDRVVELAAQLHPPTSTTARYLRRLSIESTEKAERSGDTNSFVVRDSTGLVISALQSNGNAFGSFLTSPDLGFVFHNRGSKFVLLDEGAHPNAFLTGRRGFHTLTPWMVTSATTGLPYLAVAVKGGDRQPQAFVQVLMNLVDLQLPLSQAMAAARLRHADSRDASPDVPISSFTTTLVTGGDRSRQKGVPHLNSVVPTAIEVEPGYPLTTEERLTLQRDHGLTVHEHPVDAPFEDSGFGVGQAFLFSCSANSAHRNTSSRHTAAGLVQLEAVTDVLRKPGYVSVFSTQLLCAEGSDTTATTAGSTDTSHSTAGCFSNSNKVHTHHHQQQQLPLLHHTQLHNIRNELRALN